MIQNEPRISRMGTDYGKRLLGLSVTIHAIRGSMAFRTMREV
jgi:hypothetical protein